MGEAAKKIPKQWQETREDSENEKNNIMRQDIRNTFEEILAKAGITFMGFTQKGQNKKAEKIAFLNDAKNAIEQRSISPEMQIIIRDFAKRYKSISEVIDRPEFSFENPDSIDLLKNIFNQKLEKNNPNERGFLSIDVMSLPDHENNFDHHYLASSTEEKNKPCAAQQVWNERVEVFQQKSADEGGNNLKLITHKGPDPDSILATSLYLLLRSGEINPKTISPEQEELMGKIVKLVSLHDQGATYRIIEKIGKDYFDNVNIVSLINEISNQLNSTELIYIAGLEVVRKIIENQLDPLDLNVDDFSNTILFDDKARIFKITNKLFKNWGKLKTIKDPEARFSELLGNEKISSGEKSILKKIIRHIETSSKERVKILEQSSPEELYKAFEKKFRKQMPNLYINIGELMQKISDKRVINKNAYEESKKDEENILQFSDDKKAINIKRFFVDPAEIYLDGFDLITAHSGQRGLTIYFKPDFAKANLVTLQTMCNKLNEYEAETGNPNEWKLTETGVIAPPSDRGKGELTEEKGSNLTQDKIKEIIKKILIPEAK